MTVPALPVIQAEFGTDQVTVAWVLTAFLIAASVATPIAGRLGDSLGTKRLLVASLALLAVGALLAAFATSIWLLVFARVIQGLAGGVLPLSFGIIRSNLSPRRVVPAIALLSSLMSVGFGAGIVVTGPILDLLGYRFLFLLPTLAACAAAIGAAYWIPTSVRRSGQPVRLLPAFALTGWLIALLVSISRGPSWGWTSSYTLIGLGLAVVLALVWVRIELRIDAPLIDLRLMSTRGIAAPNLVALLIGMAMFGSFAFVPQLTQTPTSSGYGFGATVAQAGHLMLPMAVMSFVGGVTSSRITERVGGRLIIVLGCWLTSIGLVSVALAHAHPWQVMAAGAVTGLGSGLVFASLANVVVDVAPPERTGVAAGINANLRTIGGSIGSAGLATIVTAHLLPNGYPVEHGYTVGFAALAGTAFLAGVAGLLIPTDRQPTYVAGPAVGTVLSTAAR